MAASILRKQIRLTVYKPHFQRHFGVSYRWLSDPLKPSLHFDSKADLNRQSGSKKIENENLRPFSGNGIESSESNGYDDAKLQQIIATSNMSAAKQVERQHQSQIELETQNKENDRQKKAENGNTINSSSLEENLHQRIREQVLKDGPEPASGSFDLPSHDHMGNKTTIKSPTVKSNSVPHLPQAKSIDLQSLKKEASKKLHQHQEKLGSWVEAKWTETQGVLRNLAKYLNDATGYSGVEKHKLLVEQVEQEISQARESVKTAKARYEQAIKKRSDSQKEINELLTRKHLWSPVDVERFTELYKNDHMNQTEEVTCKRRLEEAEKNVEAVQTRLTSSILTRYHEEQLWSDKIRQASTWGTWMLMGVNIMLFATATFFVEPWKRKKLVNAFQGEVKDRMDEYSAQLQSLSQRIEANTGAVLPTQGRTEADSSDAGSLKISFFGINSWSSLQTWARDLLAAAQVPGNFTVSLEKADFAVWSGVLVTLGWIFGSLVNFVLFSRR